MLWTLRKRSDTSSGVRSLKRGVTRFGITRTSIRVERSAGRWEKRGGRTAGHERLEVHEAE